MKMVKFIILAYSLIKYILVHIHENGEILHKQEECDQRQLDITMFHKSCPILVNCMDCTQIVHLWPLPNY